jgi:serine/threonine-protein kinase RsbT
MSVVGRVLSRTELPVGSDDDVVVIRRRVRELAHRSRLDSFATAAITTAASELARNVVVHAGRGTVALEEVQDRGSDEPRGGLRLEFRDEGPGISDLDRALAGGQSTVRSLGLGLSGSKRLVDEFHIDTAPGRGTVVIVIKWARF